MKQIIQDTRGSTSIFATFLAAVLCTLAVVVYAGAMVYSNYQTARTDLERAAIVSIDKNMLNPNVRDLEFNIPEYAALAEFENNLTLSGFEQEADGTWQKVSDQKLIYEFRDLSPMVHGEWLDVTGVFVMPVPWSFGDMTEVTIPISVRSKVLYLDL